MASPASVQMTDPAAWLDEHGDALFACALRRVGRHDLAEDLVQEALLAALQAQDRFQGRARERTWLMGILQHKIADHFRRVHRGGRTRPDTSLDRWAEELFTESGKWRRPPEAWPEGPDGESEEAELRAAMSRCLERLPDRAAETLQLAEREALTAEMIGSVLEMTATNVGVVLYRARLALRECLERSWFAQQGGSA